MTNCKIFNYSASSAQISHGVLFVPVKIDKLRSNELFFVLIAVPCFLFITGFVHIHSTNYLNFINPYIETMLYKTFTDVDYIIIIEEKLIIGK